MAKKIISEDLQMKAEKQIADLQRIIDYQIKEYTIELLIHKYQENRKEDQNDIFIPHYQRKFVWDKKKQSLFIESLLLGLPVPYMFTADNDGRSEIVDGSQRLQTMESFINNELQLIKLNKLTLLNDFKFEDLPLSRQRRFKKRTIRLIELTDKADYDARKDIFARINQNPTPLSAMEIRRGVYEGDFNNFIEQCSLNLQFQQLCPVSDERQQRREYQEMVLRFFAYSENLYQFVHSVKDFNDNYMDEKSRGFDAKSMETDFKTMLNFVNKHFPHGFAKKDRPNSTPRVRFEAIAVGVNLALKEKPDLVPAQPIENWLESDEFKEHITSDAANNRKKVRGRIEFVKNKLLIHS
jgi:Protein of unknown function DUF262